MGTGCGADFGYCAFFCDADRFRTGLEKYVHGSCERVFAHIWRAFGAEPIQWLSHASLPSLITILSWQWLPFATLILLTAIQSLDTEQLEAAEMDGARALRRFWHIILPHLARAITVVVLIQTIFLLSIFAEIFVTTAGAFGTKPLPI